MKHECMSKGNLKWTIKARIEALKKDSQIEFKITPCDLVEETYNLEIVETFLGEKK